MNVNFLYYCLILNKTCLYSKVVNCIWNLMSLAYGLWKSYGKNDFLAGLRAWSDIFGSAFSKPESGSDPLEKVQITVWIRSLKNGFKSETGFESGSDPKDINPLIQVTQWLKFNFNILERNIDSEKRCIRHIFIRNWLDPVIQIPWSGLGCLDRNPSPRFGNLWAKDEIFYWSIRAPLE